jgi:hypothetical protein
MASEEQVRVFPVASGSRFPSGPQLCDACHEAWSDPGRQAESYPPDLGLFAIVVGIFPNQVRLRLCRACAGELRAKLDFTLVHHG